MELLFFSISPKGDKMIKVSEMNPYERQLFADYLKKELLRHEDDCNKIRNDLFMLKLRYDTEPREIYCDWIEVDE